jgi:hypothetical protein
MQVAERITAEITASVRDHISQDSAGTAGKPFIVKPEMFIHSILRKEIIVNQGMSHLMHRHINIIGGGIGIPV